MSTTIQACLFNTDPEQSSDIRGYLGALNFIRLFAEVGSVEELANLLLESKPHLIFFHLDPEPAGVIGVIDEVSARYPELGMIAIGKDTRPEAILAPIRAGCDQYVCNPIDPGDLAAAVGRVASKRLLTRSTSQVFCVTGARGGIGVTSIACNLALEIGHLTEKLCALVDLDFQFGDVALFFDCDPKYTFFDLADAGGHFDRTFLDRVLTRLEALQLVLLPRPDRMEQAQTITPDVVHHAIDLLANTHEHVVVDLPRKLDPCTCAALGQADKVLVVCQLQVPSIRNTKRYIDALVHAGVPDDRILVLVNRGDSSGGRVSTKDLAEAVDRPVFGTIPNDYQYVARSLDLGRPVSASERSSPVRAAISKIARELIGDAATVGADRGGKRGLFSRLLSK